MQKLPVADHWLMSLLQNDINADPFLYLFTSISDITVTHYLHTCNIKKYSDSIDFSASDLQQIGRAHV